jgi:hypothetical protein
MCHLLEHSIDAAGNFLGASGLKKGERRHEESQIGTWIFSLQSRQWKLLKGLILLGKSVDKC